MTTITIEEAQAKLPELLKHLQNEEPLIITDDSEPVAMLLRLPKGTVPALGPAKFDVERCAADAGRAQEQEGQPIFGSCKGMLTIVSEDEEHLRDFEEYMK